MGGGQGGAVGEPEVGGQGKEEEATVGLILNGGCALSSQRALTCGDLFAVFHEAGETEVGSILAACHFLQAGQGRAGL